MTADEALQLIDLSREPDFSLAGLRVMPASREVLDGAQREALEPRIMQVLVALARHQDEVVSRDQLVASCWEGRVVGDDTINRCIAKIRHIADAHGRFSVETVPRLGYRLSVHGASRPETLAPAPTAPVIVESGDKEVPASMRTMPTDIRKRLFHWRIYDVMFAIVIVSLVAVIAISYFEADPPARVRLAVLPFDNLSPDPENAFFADGLHEEVLGTLASRATSMEVISRTTMMSYKGKRPTVAEVGKALGATHVLEGSVRRDGKDVRLTLQLIDAQTDKHMWSHNFDRALTSVMTLQSEVAGEVASQLSARLVSPTSSTPLTSDLEAYDLYLKSRAILINAGTPLARFNDAESLLTRSLERDPTFARAYLARASLHVSYFALNMDTSERRLALARADIDAARKIAPNDPTIDIVESSLGATVRPP